MRQPPTLPTSSERALAGALLDAVASGLIELCANAAHAATATAPTRAYRSGDRATAAIAVIACRSRGEMGGAMLVNAARGGISRSR